MIKLTIIFFILASVAGVFAFTNIVETVPGIAQILFYAFLAFFILSLASMLLFRRRSRNHKA